MQIERITDKAEVTTILSLDDPRLNEQVLSRIECSKAEWVQWIVDMLPNDKMRLWAIKENGKIKAYMVVLNAINPPISKACYILYQCFFGMTDEEDEPYHKELLKKVMEWAICCGAKRIAIQTDYPHVNSKLGFEEEGHSMVLKI